MNEITFSNALFKIAESATEEPLDDLQNGASNGDDGDPFGDSNINFNNQATDVANNAFETHLNGDQSMDSDPFGSASHNDDTFGGLDSNIDDLLQSNSLDNGSSEPPALLDEDANDLLDQLVDFQPSIQPHKPSHENEMNHS